MIVVEGEETDLDGDLEEPDVVVRVEETDLDADLKELDVVVAVGFDEVLDRGVDEEAGVLVEEVVKDADLDLDWVLDEIA